MGGGAYSLASTFFPPRSANEHRLATKVVETRSHEREDPGFHARGPKTNMPQAAPAATRPDKMARARMRRAG